MKEQVLLDKQVYLFELDNILFPRKDYILQVYYLFASFYEFTEGTVKASDLAGFMKKIYDYHGEDVVFDTIKEMYGVDEKYRENLERLIANGQLPLRLNLYPEMEKLLLTLFQSDKEVGVLTGGNPVEQLNKLKFIDWGIVNEYKQRLKVFFEDELVFQHIEPIGYIAQEYKVTVEEVLFIKE